MCEFDLEFDKLEKRWKRGIGKNCEIARNCRPEIVDFTARKE